MDNLSIGLIFCNNKNKIVAEYVLKDMTKPIGVSEYKLMNVLPEFKIAIDIAAEVTKDRNPQVSIVFDGLGLVLADDVKEAVRKVISILNKVRRMG